MESTVVQPQVEPTVPLQSQNYAPKYEYYPEESAMPLVDFDSPIPSKPSSNDKNQKKKLILSLVVLSLVIIVLVILIIFSCIKHVKNRKEIKRLKNNMASQPFTDNTEKVNSPPSNPVVNNDIIPPPVNNINKPKEDQFSVSTFNLLPPLNPPQQDTENISLDTKQVDLESEDVKNKYLATTSLDTIKDNVNNDVDVIKLQERKESAIYDFSSSKKRPVIVQPKTPQLVIEPENTNVLKFDIPKSTSDTTLEV